MAIVKRANVILNIKDDQVRDYLDKGYSVVSAGGKVLQQAIPTDINVLRKAYVDHVARIAQLEKQLNALSSPKSPAPVEEEQVTPSEGKKRSNKKKSAE